jgi:HEPN domain-containing protein
MKKITNDWLISAESDLAIIDRIIDQPNLTHQVAFHAQQVVEKSFKAISENEKTTNHPVSYFIGYGQRPVFRA